MFLYSNSLYNFTHVYINIPIKYIHTYLTHFIDLIHLTLNLDMLLQENGGLVRDLYFNVVNQFPRIPVQTLKPIALQPFDGLRATSLQSNAQYILFGRYIVSSGDATLPSQFVDTQFGLNANLWPALVYQHGLVFVYNAALNVALQRATGSLDSWFMVNAMNGDGTVAAYTQIDSQVPQIIQTHPVLSLVSSAPGLTTTYSLAFSRTAPSSMVFSCTFACQSEYSLSGLPQTFLSIGQDSTLDAFSLSLADTNSILVSFNSVNTLIRQNPGAYNTLTCTMFDLHAMIPKLQIYMNNIEVYSGGFTTLDAFSLAQGFGGILTLTTVGASTINFVDLCCLVPSEIAATDVARLKALTYSTSLANYFSPSGLAFTPNIALTNLVSTSIYSSFAPTTSPYTLDTSGRPRMQVGQAFTSSWIHSQNVLLVKLSVYAQTNTSSAPSVSTVFEWRGFTIELSVDQTDSTRIQVSVNDTITSAVSTILVTNVINGLDMLISGSVNNSGNQQVCRASSLSLVVNGRSVGLNRNVLGTASNLVVCNHTVVGQTPIAFLAIRQLQVLA